MSKTAEEIYDALAEAVVDMDEDLVSELSQEAVDSGVDALEAAIKKFLPAKLQEVNLKALELGKQVLKG